MRKWITKKEISEILQTYSIKKDEFEQHSIPENYSYQSKYINGYMITLQEELQGENEKTGRIIVTHTKTTGHRTFIDIWGRDKNGKIQFQFRNPWNVPASDIHYIQDLIKENEQLRQAGRELQNQLKEYQKINIDTEYIKKLEQQNEQLKVKNKKLQDRINKTEIHNARGAGRKPSKERLYAIEIVKEMLNDGRSEQEIMEHLSISRATFFRYKKCIKN